MSDKLPLYIGSKVSAELDDGPSLEVTSPGLVSCRFPLRRISRLIICAGADVPSESIIACLKSHIPVTWHDRGGRALAVALPLDCRALEWAERIAVMMGRPDWRSSYEMWAAAQKNIALRSLAARIRLPIDHRKQQDEWIARLLHRHGIRQAWAMHLMDSWQGMMASLMVEYWRTLDVQVDLLISPADGWNVLHDMADCLVLDMIPELVARKKRWAQLLPAPRQDINFALIQSFERRSPRLLRLAAAMHSRFCRWLLEMEPWR